MCRLFGCITKNRVNINFSFFDAPKPFKSLLEKNKDGWGIGWYTKTGKANIFKEGLQEVKNDINRYRFSKVKRVASNIILSHVREASVGDKKHENAHPFKYKNWIFIQNGRTDRENSNIKLESKYKKCIKGTTDSELYFLLIMQNYEKTKNMAKSIQNTLEVVKQRATGLNFLLSNGKKLYAYRNYNKTGKRFTLYYLIRDLKSAKKPIEHVSKKTNQMLQSSDLHTGRTVLFCSEPLTDEKWTRIHRGELIKVDENLNVRITKL